ncbi:MAG: hypothetical protein M3025_04750 [Actinomycetota bacterium]|nr:hypothetical protein [Actinomycetota bacterium]
MSATSQLSYESRMRPRYAALAATAAVLLLAAAVIQQLGPHTKVTELTVELLTANKRFSLDLLSAFVNAIGSIALALTLAFLFRMASIRNPRRQPYVKVFVYAGGALVAVTSIAYAVVIGIKAHQFATTGAQTYVEANRLTTSPILLILQLIGEVAALLLTAAYALVALNAMRVGLLTRFMGYLGVFAGALVLLQVTQVPVVQAYWLIALAVLMAGRWPSGTPKAWESGRAEPWPSNRAIREQRMRGGGAPPPRGGRRRAAPAPAPVAAPRPSSTRTSAKRKRKRRK